jgi:DNA-binding response OmpR family regulator
MARVLIIEDEPSLLKFLSQNLALRGWDVVAVADGQEGLRQARETRPDLILLDLMLPVVSGWEVLETLRQEGVLRSVPVIVVTAAARAEEERRARWLGATDYLLKPFGVPELLRRISAIVPAPVPAHPARATRNYTLGGAP